MACFHPLTAFRTADGQVVFDERKAERGSGLDRGVVSRLSLACGRCIGCKVGKSMDWQTRLVHESVVAGRSICVCLTYDEAELPVFGSLSRADAVLFVRRLRKVLWRRFKVRVRFFLIGEYSPEVLRPHYHAVLYGWFPADARAWSKSGAGGVQYVSDLLTESWGKGHVTFQPFSEKAAAYCARYMTQKVSDSRSEAVRRVVDADTGEVVGVRESEFMRCSRRPGIGAEFFRRFAAQLRAHDYTVIDGRKRPLPRYYDRLHERVDAGELSERKAAREVAAVSSAAERLPDRLAVRETVAAARLEHGKQRGALDR